MTSWDCQIQKGLIVNDNEIVISYMSGEALISLRSGDALTTFGGGLRGAVSWFSEGLTVDPASHRLPVLFSRVGAIQTPVIHRRLLITGCIYPLLTDRSTDLSSLLLRYFLMLFPRARAQKGELGARGVYCFMI